MPFNRWVDSRAGNVNWDASQVDVPCGDHQQIPAPSRCHVSKAGRIFRSPFFPCPASVTQAVRVQYQAFSHHRRHCFHLTHNNGCPGTFNHTSSCSQPHSFLSLAARVFSCFLLSAVSGWLNPRASDAWQVNFERISGWHKSISLVISA